MIDLVAFASALCAKASPGPNGRRFVAWAWGADTRNPDCLLRLVSASGHELASHKVTAFDWDGSDDAERVTLVTNGMRSLVASAIHPTDGTMATGLPVGPHFLETVPLQ